MFCIAHLTHRRLAVYQNHAHLTRGKLDLRIPPLFGHQLGITACTSHQLTPFAGVQLHVVDLGTEGHVSKGQYIAGFNVGRLACDNCVTHCESMRCHDIPLLPIHIMQKRYAR